jgi:predicted aldo/keto reductase-like oxidoreductase
MTQLKRRDVLKMGAALGGSLVTGTYRAVAQPPLQKRSATDWVRLGKSDVRVTRLAFGTGSQGGRVQRELGQKEFTRLVRHAYDRGIRFFESADNYREMHEMLATALRGIDRSSYKLMTKIRPSQAPDAGNPQKFLDRFRKELNSDYFDILLMHCMQTSDWPKENARLMDQLDEMKEKQVLLAHGASCHGLPALREMPGVDWLDVALLRVNHDGTHMDGDTGDWGEPGRHDQAVASIEKIHAGGTGVIGMKLIGNGNFTSPEQRDASIKFVMNLDCVDAVTIGFKAPSEIDEAITRINKHLNA